MARRYSKNEFDTSRRLGKTQGGNEDEFLPKWTKKAIFGLCFLATFYLGTGVRTGLQNQERNKIETSPIERIEHISPEYIEPSERHKEVISYWV